VGHILIRRGLPAELWNAEPAYATRTWLRVSVPLILAQQTRMLMDRTDLILIGLMLGPESAGIYFIASRIASFGNFGLLATNAIATPLVAELHRAGDQRQLQRTVTLASWGTMALAIPIALAIVIGHPLVIGLFGTNFDGAATPMLILLAAAFGNAFTGPIGPMLNMTGNQDDNLRVVVATAVMNLVLNYPAILLWGMSGAALATASSMTVSNIASWYYVRRRTGINSSVFAREQIRL
jgi:O-antigen/teichoic acid export membrane protein